VELKATALAHCRMLYLLHGVRGRANDGEKVAEVQWRYDDGQTATESIIYGEHVRDFWFWNYEPVSDPGSAMAWTGSNPAVRAQGGSLRLYRTSLENPRPEARLIRVEIQAESDGTVIPFIAGVTAQLGEP
jgi:hypothetical protein